VRVQIAREGVAAAAAAAAAQRVQKGARGSEHMCGGEKGFGQYIRMTTCGIA
jgi:hypothetical protein